MVASSMMLRENPAENMGKIKTQKKLRVTTKKNCTSNN
jgi:hypothetical protein